MAFKDYYEKNHKLIAGFLRIGTVYLFLVLFYYLVFVKFSFYWLPLIDKHMGPGYGVAWSSALLEDLFFFGILGFFATVITSLFAYIKPEDNVFQARLKSLANSNKIEIDEQLYQYIKSQALNFLAYNRAITVNIEIRDYDPNDKTFLIFSDIEFNITNMCKDIDYEDNEAKTFISAEIHKNGDYGTLIFLGELENPILQMVRLAKKEFSHQFLLKIERNSEVSWWIKHQMWASTGDVAKDTSWNYFELFRYTRTVTFNLKNCIVPNKVIKFDVKIRDHDKDKAETPVCSNIELAYNVNQSVTFKNLNGMYPGDKIMYYICEPQ